jgi:hypothetical protein
MNFESLEDFLTRNASTGNRDTAGDTNSNSGASNNDYSAFDDHVAFLNSNFGIGPAYETTNVNNAEVVEIKPEPNTPSLPPATSNKSPVKSAPIDTILFDDNSMSIDRMFNLILEDIGGQELINIARNDIINGQTVSYQPIKNLSSIQQQYNPNNILGIQNTSDRYFSNFSIKFENKIPNYINDLNKSNVYLDNQTGDLVIETVNMETDEQIEIEITVSATIYEAEFGENVS